MERLTIPDVRVDEHTTRRTIIDARVVREHAMDFYWRLKAYEDKGLTVEEIDMDHEAAEQLRHLCRNCDLDRLEKLAEADEDGRIEVLPCKVGDVLYRASPSGVVVHRVANVMYRGLTSRWYIDTIPNLPYASEELGKTTFLTREEAEKALEAMKDGN